jgi:hypothetical protein
MNRSKDLILNSLEYYDKSNQRFERSLSRVKYISFKKNNKDAEHQSMIFYDKDKNEIFESRFEIIGLYNNYGSVWTWAWSIPYLYKNTTYISRKILNYGLDIIPTSEDKFLKTELITSRFRISDLIQLDIHVGIASYLSKIPAIFKVVIDPEKPQEVLKLKDINRMDEQDQIYYYFLLDSDKIEDENIIEKTKETSE